MIAEPQSSEAPGRSGPSAQEPGPREGGHQFGGHQFGGHQFGGMYGGCLSDVPDFRDEPLYGPVGSAQLAAPPRPRPALRDDDDPDRDPVRLAWEVPVLNQQRSLSCVSCAVASVVWWMDSGGADSQTVHRPGPAPTFLYYNARHLEGHERCDTGTSIRTALKALRRYGICGSSDAEDRRALDVPPDGAAYAGALYDGGIEYRHVYRNGEGPDDLDLSPVRQALRQGLPVIFGFAVYEGFRAAAAGGVVPLPTGTQRVLFGHAAVLIGYTRGASADGSDDTCTAVNSWGRRWGTDGTFVLPAAYLRDRRLAKDFWVITSLTPPDDSGDAREEVEAAD